MMDVHQLTYNDDDDDDDDVAGCEERKKLLNVAALQSWRHLAGGTRWEICRLELPLERTYHSAEAGTARPSRGFSLQALQVLRSI